MKLILIRSPVIILKDEIKGEDKNTTTDTITISISRISCNFWHSLKKFRTWSSEPHTIFENLRWLVGNKQFDRAVFKI